jgi:predicted RNA binding protein with dsRBD fold (UPF0201 family)
MTEQEKREAHAAYMQEQRRIKKENEALVRRCQESTEDVLLAKFKLLMEDNEIVDAERREYIECMETGYQTYT